MMNREVFHTSNSKNLFEKHGVDLELVLALEMQEKIEREISRREQVIRDLCIAQPCLVFGWAKTMSKNLKD